MTQKRRMTDPVSLERAVTVEFIKNSGGFAVKAGRGQKEPKNWDPKANDRIKSDTLLADIANTDDNIGVHLHGDIVDVDVDTDSPYIKSALDLYLPPCAHVWGRASNQRSHRVYQLRVQDQFDPGTHPLLKRIKRIPEAQVEVRGGPQSRGEYSLLPGSIHPSGEPYEWADIGRARSSISVTTPDILLRGIRLAGAIAVIAPYWVEGLRNDLTMALSGFLHRAATMTPDVDEGLGEFFCLGEEDSLNFLEALMDLVGDDEKDRHSRVKTFKQTWKKANDGVPVTGASTIAELTGDQSIVEKLYALLSDNPNAKVMEEFLERFAIWQGPGVVVDMSRAVKGDTKPLMTRQQFVNSWGHKFVDFAGKKKLLADVLFHIGATTRVMGLTFTPGGDEIVEENGGRKINQWAGFAIPPYKDPVPDAEVQKFLDYIWEVVANENKQSYEWVLGWLSHIFKTPENKSGTALVLVGKPGAGKSILGHSILMPIIGDNHSIATNSVESIVANFNVSFDNKLFIQCDEATNSRQKSIANKMKSMITDPWRRVEPKNIDAYYKPNHSRFLFTSNEMDDAVHISDGMDDRRYTVLEVSPRYKDDIEGHWVPFVEWLQLENTLSKIHRWLRDYEFDRGFISRPLHTEAKAVMQESAWDTFDMWLATWVARDHPLSKDLHRNWYDAYMEGEKKIDRSEWPDMISPTALAADYERFCKTKFKYGVYSMNESQLMRALYKRGLRHKDEKTARLKVTEFDDKIMKNVTSRVRVYSAPTKDMIEEYLISTYSYHDTLSIIDDVKEIEHNEGKDYDGVEF